MTYDNDPKHEAENDNLNKGIDRSSDSQSTSKEDAEVESLLEEEKQVAQAQRVIIYRKLNQSISYLVGALEILLGLRFLLKLTGANQENVFASFIYSFSKPFVVPFSNLFNDLNFNEGANIFEINLLFGMLIYLVLMLLAKWLINIIITR